MTNLRHMMELFILSDEPTGSRFALLFRVMHEDLAFMTIPFIFYTLYVLAGSKLDDVRPSPHWAV